MELDGAQHYVICFNRPVDFPLAVPFCSADAERLSEEDLLDFIHHPPPEELHGQ
jgi:hypothetical protein